MNLDMDAIDLKVLADVEKHGWSGISVFPTEDDPGTGMPFSYTAGLTKIPHSELIVIGLSAEIMHGMLWSAYDAITGGHELKPNTYTDRVLEDHRVACVAVDEVRDTTYPMSMAFRLFGPITGLQLVWPDAQDRFPWHEGYTDHFRKYQTLLGTWRGEE